MSYLLLLKLVNVSETVMDPFCRFDIAINDIEKWTNNLLPSRQFGHVVLTTSGGIMDHEEARRKHLGGKILGFFF